MTPFNTPVLLIAFNRPKEIRAVIDALRKIKPTRVYVAIDAPRQGRADDAKNVAEVKRVIDTAIDWSCIVQKRFQDKNLGCGYGPAAAITWFFKNVEAGIILEDDCVADPSFFVFCEELLKKYKDNPQVMHITGDNYQDGQKRGIYSYFFSKYTFVWGWATWRRAWQHFDHTLIPEKDRGHVWDGAWIKSVRKQKGYAIIPQVNLVQNIGFGENATHTRNVQTGAEYKAGSMLFPLSHPPKITWNIAADYYAYRHFFKRSIIGSITYRLRKLTHLFIDKT